MYFLYTFMMLHGLGAKCLLIHICLFCSGHKRIKILCIDLGLLNTNVEYAGYIQQMHELLGVC
jgi:hypothetical protein